MIPSELKEQLDQLIQNSADIILTTLKTLPGEESKKHFLPLALEGFAKRVTQLVEKHITEEV